MGCSGFRSFPSRVWDGLELNLQLQLQSLCGAPWAQTCGGKEPSLFGAGLVLRAGWLEQCRLQMYPISTLKLSPSQGRKEMVECFAQTAFYLQECVRWHMGSGECLWAHEYPSRSPPLGGIVSGTETRRVTLYFSISGLWFCLYFGNKSSKVKIKDY